jgi:hypothetical protein
MRISYRIQLREQSWSACGFELPKFSLPANLFVGGRDLGDNVVDALAQGTGLLKRPKETNQNIDSEFKSLTNTADLIHTGLEALQLGRGNHLHGLKQQSGMRSRERYKFDRKKKDFFSGLCSSEIIRSCLHCLTLVIRWIDLTDASRRRSCLTDAFRSPRTTASGIRCVITCHFSIGYLIISNTIEPLLMSSRLYAFLHPGDQI